MSLLETRSIEETSFWRALALEGAPMSAKDLDQWDAALTTALSELSGAYAVVKAMPQGSGFTSRAFDELQAVTRRFEEDVQAWRTRARERTQALNKRCDEFERRRKEGASPEELAALKEGLVW